MVKMEKMGLNDKMPTFNRLSEIVRMRTVRGEKGIGRRRGRARTPAPRSGPAFVLSAGRRGSSAADHDPEADGRGWRGRRRHDVHRRLGVDLSHRAIRRLLH